MVGTRTVPIVDGQILATVGVKCGDLKLSGTDSTLSVLNLYTPQPTKEQDPGESIRSGEVHDAQPRGDRGRAAVRDHRGQHPDRAGSPAGGPDRDGRQY